MGVEVGLKVLVTGANGFVGAHLVRRLRKSGYDVRRAVRELAGEAGEDVVAVGELSGETDWSRALHGVDLVVHSAARVHVLHESVHDPDSAFRSVNVDATRELALQAAEAGVKRLVFLSTIGVLGNYSLSPFTEADKAHPSNRYSTSKWEAEQALWSVARSTGLEVVVVRPPLVYGPGVKANFLRLMEAVDHGRILPFSWVKNARDFISIRNLYHFIEHCLQHPAAANQTYLICDEEPVSTPDLVRALASEMGRTPRLVPVPHWFLRLAACMLRKERFYHSVCSSLRIETTKARHELNWQPVETMEEGLRQTVAWYLSQKGAAHGTD